jgi:hypothetical protein
VTRNTNETERIQNKNVQFTTGPAAGVKLKQERSKTYGTIEGIEEDFHGAFGADPSDVCDWLNKDEEDFGYQNCTKEKIAQQAEKNGSSEEDEEDEKKEETCAKLKFLEVKQNLDSIISSVDSNPQYSTYYLKLREIRQDVAKEQYKRGRQTEISSFLNTVTIILSM